MYQHQKPFPPSKYKQPGTKDKTNAQHQTENSHNGTKIDTTVHRRFTISTTTTIDTHATTPNNSGPSIQRQRNKNKRQTHHRHHQQGGNAWKLTSDNGMQFLITPSSAEPCGICANLETASQQKEVDEINTVWSTCVFDCPRNTHEQSSRGYIRAVGSHNGTAKIHTQQNQGTCLDTDNREWVSRWSDGHYFPNGGIIDQERCLETDLAYGSTHRRYSSLEIPQHLQSPDPPQQFNSLFVHERQSGSEDRTFCNPSTDGWGISQYHHTCTDTDEEIDALCIHGLRRSPAERNRRNEAGFTLRGTSKILGGDVVRYEGPSKRWLELSVSPRRFFKRRAARAFTSSLKRHTSVVPGSGYLGQRECFNTNENNPHKRRVNEKCDFGKRVLGRTLCGSINARSTRRPTIEQLNQLPLHVKSVPRISLEEVALLLAEFDDLTMIWNQAWDSLTDAQSIANILPLQMPPSPEADLSDDDINKLLLFDYIEETENSQVRASVRAFTTLEKADTRRRFLAVPDLLNEIQTEPGQISLPSIEEQLRDVALPFARCGDFAAYYASFSLPLHARPFYCFPFKGRWYRLKTISTGQRQCPALAQALSTALARKVLLSFPDVRITIYIDNVRISSSSQVTLDAAWELFLQLAEKLGTKFETQGSTPAYLEFLGIEYDHLSSRVRVSQRGLDKLRLKHVADSMTRREFFSLLGSLIWMSRVTKISLAQYYAVVKFLRRLAVSTTEDTMDQQAQLWPSIIAPINEWRAVCLTNNWFDYKARVTKPTTFLFSDASLHGWSATIFHGNELLIFFGPWLTLGNHINEYEALACRNAVIHLPRTTDEHHHLAMFIDNTSWHESLNNMFPRNFTMFAANYYIKGKVREKGYSTWSSSWVNTLSMLADHFTRLKYDQVFQQMKIPLAQQLTGILGDELQDLTTDTNAEAATLRLISKSIKQVVSEFDGCHSLEAGQ